MPVGAVKTKRDEAKWERAKAIVEEQLRKKGGKKPKDKWPLVMSIYQNMGPSTAKSLTPMERSGGASSSGPAPKTKVPKLKMSPVVSRQKSQAKRKLMKQLGKAALVLDLEKSELLQAFRGTGNPQSRWSRYPGAASMLPQHRERMQHEKLYTEMPTPKLMVSDGNFTSPYDVVKGLGFSHTDETLWAHRVARLVSTAPNEVVLRKSALSDLRSNSLEPILRSELSRRIISFYRQNRGEKPLPMTFAKAFAPAPQKPMKPAPAKQPPPKPDQDDEQQQESAGEQPTLDDAELDAQPQDPALLRAHLHKLHDMLRSTHGDISTSPGAIHMHNELKSELRDAFADPNPEEISQLDHKIRQYVKMIQGPEAEAQPQQPPGQPPGRFGQPPPKPGMQQAGNPPPFAQGR